MPEKLLTKQDADKAIDAVLEDGYGKVLIVVEDHVILEIEKNSKRRREKGNKA